jgi:pyruvate/2-oxoglutarate dehydrogenase complex dihydrolipoamide dehydrogenase (E3) component
VTLGAANGGATAERGERFDAVVVGAGSGGLTVAYGLARTGKRVALVEAEAIGGDCTNVGCIPSKTLLAASRQLAARGLRAGDPGWADAAREVLAFVRAKRDALREREDHEVAVEANLTLVRGRARLLAPDRVAVRPVGDAAPAAAGAADAAPERVLAAPVVVLATGARAVTIPLPGLEADVAITNATLFDLVDPPRHLAVIGGGAIGAEMATAFARLGSRVTLVEAAPQLLPAAPAAAAELVTAGLRARGVAMHVGAKAVRYERHGGVLHLETDGGPLAVAGVDRVLVAVGRRPNVEGLGLEALGVRVGRGGIATDRAHRTSVRGVYAIGDATERAKFTHAANAQGRRLVRHLTAPWLPLVAEGDYPAATFTEPEVAQIGPSLAALHERYGPELVVTHRVDLGALDRGYVEGLEAGFVEVHAMRLTGRLLAATVVGPHAAEVVQLLVWLQRRRGSLWQLSRHVVAYPALSEGLKKVADAFVFATLPKLPRELGAYLRHRPATRRRAAAR